jgi:hypothetical protein
VNNKTIAVWFSCGAASAVAAFYTLNQYKKDNEVLILNNPVKEEHEDNQRFLNDCEKWFGQKIIKVVNKNYPDYSCETVWQKRKFMSGVSGAPCTFELKKKARQQWEQQNHVDFHVLGFTADERTRHERFVLTERENVIPVLIEKNITKQDCVKILINNNIRLPKMYELGYPNANCIGCVKATSPTYWNKVRETHPDIFLKRCETSRKIGSKLVRVKNKRIFLDELKTTDKGRPLKSLAIECGTFCEEI